MILRTLLFLGFIFIVALIGYGINRLGHFLCRNDSFKLGHFEALFMGLLVIGSWLGALCIVALIVLGCWDLAGYLLG